MNFCRCAFLGLSLFLAIGTAIPRAQAQARIGEAVVVRNEVVNAATAAQINVGDGVLRDEIVRTGRESATRLAMADSTNVSLGPNATLKLDRSVFNEEHSYRALAIRMVSGAFRFVTGHSDKAAYKITTPLAQIGVRGTIVDILSQRASSIVVLQEGAASVCTLSGHCIQLTEPGDTAIISSTNGRVSIQKTSNPPWTFSQTCAAAAGLCAVTDFADADAPDDPNALCGR